MHRQSKYSLVIDVENSPARGAQERQRGAQTGQRVQGLMRVPTLSVPDGEDVQMITPTLSLTCRGSDQF